MKRSRPERLLSAANGSDVYELDLLRLEPPLLPPLPDFSLPLPLEEEDLVLLEVAECRVVSVNILGEWDGGTADRRSSWRRSWSWCLLVWLVVWWAG